MKNVLRFVLTVAAINLAIFYSESRAQSAASVTWNLTTTDTTHPSTIVGNLTADDIKGEGMVIRSYTGTPNGPLGVPHMRWWPTGGASWGLETAEVPTRYIQLSVSPKTGNSFYVDSLSIFLLGGGTSTMRANAYYSTAADFSTRTLLNTDSAITLLNSGSAPSSVRFAYKIGITVPNAKTFYVRIYPYYMGAASTSKYIYTQLATITGTTSSATAVTVNAGITPSAFALEQNYPNPFNPSTEIAFSLKASGYTTLKIYNLIGNEVTTLVNGQMSAGSYTTRFDASQLPSGMYISVLTSNGRSLSSKMVLMK
ncbi:MAG TPA: T9SS type A sorting domain-containing protein [Bacteroidota bacterium]|nr:T9SS type A sorting domain-containing protein [Bacteroidota bacterium]